MEIIQTYNELLVSKSDRQKWVKRFGCTKCGCVFDATWEEFYEEKVNGEWFPVCTCPVCNNTTGMILKMEE